MSKLIIALILCCAGTAVASEQIARDNQCLKCHAMDTKKKAPSFHAIAQRSDANQIAQAIRKGITSFFGAQKMPANTTMTDVELKSLTEWILQQ